MFKVVVKKLQHILKFHKIRSTFYTESTSCKLICKPKDWVAAEDENNIVYEIDCSNWKAVYFHESKQVFKIAFKWTQKVCQVLQL